MSETTEILKMIDKNLSLVLTFMLQERTEQRRLERAILQKQLGLSETKHENKIEPSPNRYKRNKQ